MNYLIFLGYDKINSMSMEELEKEIICGNMNIGELWCWALKYNCLDIIKAFSSKIDDCPGSIDIVAEHGHLDMLKWLYDNRKEYFTLRAIELAAANGHLKVVQFLYNNLACNTNVNFGIEYHLKNAVNDAAKNGHLDIIKWLYYNTGVNVTDPHHIQNAYFFNRKDVLNWLEDEICGR